MNNNTNKETTEFIKPIIKSLSDINGNAYYVIVNPERNDDAYYCFKTLMEEESWRILEENYSIISDSKVEITYRTQEKESLKGPRVYKQVTNLFIFPLDEDINI